MDILTILAFGEGGTPTAENLSIYAVLIAVITYLLNEKKKTEKKIDDLHLKIEQIQKDRLDESKSVVELTIELINKINGISR
jgi:hypothetical protein